MEILLKALADRRVKWGLVGCCVLALAGGWIAWRAGVDLAQVGRWWRQLNEFLTAHPGALFWALVFLPALPIPTSALLFTAGIVWRDRPAMAVSLCLLAMALNLSWTYWLAAGPARGIAEKLLTAGSIRIPDLPRKDHLKLILIMRLTPGLPFFVQNYVLGFLRPPFLLYLGVSMLCSGVIGTGVVLSGAGLGGGNLQWAILGISLIVVGGIVTHFVRAWLAKRKRSAG
jgi:uncharacterized membrane protein YdjX (TVP38/TMEM64 family)